MVRSVFRVLAAAVVAVGLLLSPGVLGASAKSKKSDSSKSVKKDKGKKDKGKKDKGKKDKKGAKSKKDKGKKGDKKSNKKDKSSKKSSKSSKKEPVAEKRTARPAAAPASHRSRSDDSHVASTSGSRSKVEPTYVSGSDGDASDEADEPDLPKPANRVVADISSARVTQIQAALIKQGLLAGPPNGVYDQATYSAMASFQTRNGWNPVGVPTASSLKALGVPKNSGRPYPSPSRVVEETAPTP